MRPDSRCINQAEASDECPASPSGARAGLVRGTRKTLSALPAPRAGSFELHALPGTARKPPAREFTHPDDEQEADRADIQHCAHQDMSRAPLLVRSSPAQGTGSYGGLPVLSVSSSPVSDLDDDQLFQRSKRKGKGKSRQSELALSHSTALHRSENSNSNSNSNHSAPAFTTSRTRRRSTKGGKSGSEALHASFSEYEDSGLEPRFNSSRVSPVSVGAPGVFHSLQSSSASSQFEDSEGEDSESVHGDGFDHLRPNGHPSDNSPYAAVRASVAATDDISLSINTPRMWTLALLFAILGSSTNLFFSLRYPSVSITPIIALLLVHPLGLLWDQFLKRADDPDEIFLNGYIHHRNDSGSQGPRKSRFRLWLAQGRWNAKEHCCVYISSNVSFGFAFATDVSSPSAYSVRLALIKYRLL